MVIKDLARVASQRDIRNTATPAEGGVRGNVPKLQCSWDQKRKSRCSKTSSRSKTDT